MNRLEEIKRKQSLESPHDSVSDSDVDWLIAEVEVQRREGGKNQSRYRKEKYITQKHREALAKVYSLWLNDGHFWLDSTKTLDEIGSIVRDAVKLEERARRKHG